MAALCIFFASLAAAAVSSAFWIWRLARPAGLGFPSPAGRPSNLTPASHDHASPVYPNQASSRSNGHADPRSNYNGVATPSNALVGAGDTITLPRSLPQYSQVAGQTHPLLQRAETVEHLLDFSQTIQGAGKVEQIFPTLAHYLRTGLNLAGLVVLTFDTDQSPALQVRAAWPDDLLCAPGVAEIDTQLCPCLRQNLPRHFKADGSPVRCAIDTFLKFPPSHPAYCIPFTIGRKIQTVVHMLLPPGGEWTEPLRQLAQAYVNAGHAALTSLHLLAEAEKQSMTDVLTGLYNRRSMDQLLEREMALAERHGHPLSVVMIDIDHFKKINDAHGHAAGDHLLKSFADCVRITLRKTDLAFRYGGDEFAIALPQTPLSQAQQVVQKLRQAFLAVDFSHAIAHLDERPTLSIGVAERSKANNLLNLPSLLSAADQALYTAKNTSRNCIRVYEPPQAA